VLASRAPNRSLLQHALAVGVEDWLIMPFAVEQCVEAASKEFVRKFFGGSTELALEYFKRVGERRSGGVAQ
jgi:hypothetical protein